MPYLPQPSACLPGHPGGQPLGGWASLGLALSAVLVLSPVARAEVLSAWQFAPATQQLTFTLPTGITPQYAVEPDPTRIVVILPQTQLGAVPVSQTYDGAVRQISLNQVNDSTVVTLDLVPGATLADQGASLIAIPAGDQTRWVLTALAVLPGGAQPQTAFAQPPVAAPQMIVELPVLPSTAPQLGFPAPGTGRLSTSAGNLMLPSDIDNLTNLPGTLPVDSFNLSRPGEQVSVPSLAELDAVVGPVATAPLPSTLTLEPPSLGTAPLAASPAPAQAPIDSETSGIPIAVTPSGSPSPEASGLDPAAIAIEPPAAPPAQVESSPTPGAIAVEPPAIPPTVADNAAPVVAIEPPVLPRLETAIAPQSPTISQEPPAIATIPVAAPNIDPNLLSVPTAPRASSSGDVILPTPPLVLAAAGEPILFGTPLPGDRPQGTFPEAASPLPPDTLVAAGTLLQLRYVGPAPLDLNLSSSQNHVLLLAQDIRDPITNGVVAPAGSQLIGQFESSPNGQRWISRMLIAPAGQQVPFASTSDYIVGTPDVTSPRLAAGAGLGALALMLVTGFSGVGLIGGALVGATTALGTAPQAVVIEPNQIIHVQVIQDIPRSIPIASAPENSREWGVSGW